jgi:hypothetical protein
MEPCGVEKMWTQKMDCHIHMLPVLTDNKTDRTDDCKLLK